jgi:uncharacterized protein
VNRLALPTPKTEQTMTDGFPRGEGSVRRVYRNLLIGLLILGLTAIPCTLSANRVLKTMSNAPITWLPKDEPAFKDWLGYLERYHFVDVLFLSWDGCEIGSSEVDAVYQALKPYTEPTSESPVPPLTQLFTGDQVYRKLCDAPLELSHKAACTRLCNTLVGPDEKTTCIIMGLSVSGSKEFDKNFANIRATLMQHPALASKTLRFVGPRMEKDAIDRASQQAIDQFWLPSLGLGILICFLFLRSLPLTIAVLAVALSSQGWALAIIEWLGGEINAVLIVLLPLSFVLTVSSGIHLSNYYLDSWRSNPNIGLNEILGALRMGRLPCFLAALTTIVGLLSLWWVPLWPLQWFGAIGGFLTGATLAMLWLILPGAMHLDLLWKRRRVRPASSLDSDGGTKANDIHKTRFGFLARGLEKSATWVLLGFAVLVISLVAGVFHLKTTVDVEQMLPSGHQLKSDYTWFEAKVGPLVNAEMEIEFPHGSIDSFHDRVELVRAAHSALIAADSSCGVLSAATFLPKLPTGGGLSSVSKRSVMRRRIEEQFSSILESGFAAQENGSEYWRLSLRYPFHSEIDSATRLQTAQQEVNAILASHPQVKLKVSGTTALAEVAQQLLFDGLIKSFLSTFLLIWLSMLAMLRSVPSSLIAMLPNLFPFLTLFGAMGLLNVPLDIGVVMSASLALGIAVDDTIHFLTQYRASLREGFPRAAAVHEALKHCGVAMMQSTAICVVTMILYTFSDFVPTMKFSLLMCALLFAALIGDMIMLPALLWSRLGFVTELRKGS